MLKKSMLLILSFFLLVCGCNKNVVRTHNKLILSYDIIVNESYNNVKYIGKCLEDALEEIGAEDPNIYFTSEKVYIKITSEDEIDINEIKNVIEKTSKVELSFRDFENNLLATGEEILEDVGATLSEEVDQYGYPIILLNIKDTQKLSSITEQVSSLSDNHLVVWLGFEEGDDYANIKTDASVAKKIIYNAAVTEKLYTDTLTITGSFSKANALKAVQRINCAGKYSLKNVNIRYIEADK